jgi:hypothetical protein
MTFALKSKNEIQYYSFLGLTAAAAQELMSVTVDGEPVDHVQCLVENGDLKMRLSRGTFIIVR